MISTINNNTLFRELKGGSKDFNEMFQIVNDSFEKVIKPLYGDQSEALKKIKAAYDRTALILYNDKNPVGILVQKTKPENDFNGVSLQNSIEIKTLIVIDPKTNSGKGFGSLLLNKSIENATQQNADSIHVTVNDKVKESLGFFKAKKFKIIKSFENLYKKGDTEHLLKLALRTEGQRDKIFSTNNLDFKRVRGFEHNEIKMDDFCKKNINADTTTLMNKVREDYNYCSRLLYDKINDKTIGVLVIEKRLLKNSKLNVKLIGIDIDVCDNIKKTVANDLLIKIRSAADERKAKSILIPIENTNEFMINVLKENNYTIKRVGTTNTIMKCMIEEQKKIEDKVITSPKQNRVTLRQPYIKQIKSGAKTIEGRIDRGLFANIKVGDRINFYCNNDDVNCTITKKIKYNSFNEMLSAEGYKKCLPEASSYEEASKIYKNIPGYEAPAKTHGVLALGVKAIK